MHVVYAAWIHVYIFALGSSLPHEPGTSCVVSKVHSFVALPNNGLFRFIHHSNFPNAGVHACALVSIIFRLVVVVGLHMVSGDTAAQRYGREDICWKATHVQAGFRLTKTENGWKCHLSSASASHVSRLIGKRKSGSKVSPHKMLKFAKNQIF